MKKIFFLACAAFALTASAEDIIGCTPVTISGAGKAGTAKVYINKDGYDKTITQIQYEVYPAEGLSVASAAFFTGEGTLQPVDIIYEEDWDNCDEDGNPALKEIGKTYPATFQKKTYTDGHLCVVIQNATRATYQPGNGQLATVVFRAAADCAVGVYPVYFKNVKVSGTDAVTHKLPDAVCYVKVGNPTDATLKLEGIVPSFVDAELAKDAAISKIDLSDVTGMAQFTYADGHAVVEPSAAFTTVLKYNREASSSTYGSLCLPFEAEVNCYTLQSAKDGNAHFVSNNTAPAGEAVLVDGTKAIAISTNGTIGAIENKTITSGFYVKGDKLYSVNGTAKVPACKGYWTEGDGSNMRIVIDGLTGIEEATIDANETAFDLQGRRVVNAKNGLYIVNGKKQIVK